MPGINDYDYQLNLPVGTEFVKKINQLIQKLEKINENDLKVKVDLTGYITSLEIVRDYQKKLVNGKNIKTINGQAILGSGDLKIESEVKKETIGSLPNLTTANKTNLVAAINEIDKLVDDLTKNKIDRTEAENLAQNLNTSISNLNTLINNLETNKATKIEVNSIKNDLSTVKSQVNTISNQYIKKVEYSESNGIFTFTLQDGTTKKIDLAIEKVVANFEYDTENNTLILTLADGTKQNVPLTALVDDFDGVDGQTIKVTVSSDNKISAELKGKTIGEEHLTDALLNKINEGTGGSTVVGPDKYLKEVEYDSSNGIITFTLHDDTKKQVDIPVEKTVKNFQVVNGNVLRLTLNDNSYLDATLETSSVDAYTKTESDEKFVTKETFETTLDSANAVLESLNKKTIELDSSVKEIEESYVKNVSYEPNAGIFTFTMQDGSVRTVDLAIEKVVTNFVYDSNTKSLVLTLADGTTQSIPLTDFIKDYTGKDGDQIQVSIVNHEIQVILKNGSITLSKLSDEVKNNFATKEYAYSKAESDENYVSSSNFNILNNTVKSQGDRITALEQSGGSGGGGSTSAAITEEITVSSSSWVALNNAGVAPYTYSANLQPTNLTDDSLSIELINNQPVLFAKHGFAIMYVSDGMVELYSIGQPTADVTLTFEVVG